MKIILIKTKKQKKKKIEKKKKNLTKKEPNYDTINEHIFDKDQ